MSTNATKDPPNSTRLADATVPAYRSDPRWSSTNKSGKIDRGHGHGHADGHSYSYCHRYTNSNSNVYAYRYAV